LVLTIGVQKVRGPTWMDIMNVVDTVSLPAGTMWAMMWHWNIAQLIVEL